MSQWRLLDTRRLRARAARIALALALVALLIPAGRIHAQIWRGIDVDPIDDDDPTAGCTLREAIDLANAGYGPGIHPNGCTVTQVPLGPEPDVLYIIDVPAFTYTLTGAAGDDANASGDLDIAADVWIFGAGAGLTIISGGSLDRVFHVDPASAGDAGGWFADLTITQGSVVGGGGGILNEGGSVFISECALTGNQAYDLPAGGGAISNDNGTLIVEDTTLSANHADNGGAIYSSGTLKMTNTTLSANTANTSGGGLFNAAGTAAVINVTITANTADVDVDAVGRGGGIYVSAGTVTLKNTIVAGNAQDSPGPGDLHPDLSGNVLGDATNLIGDRTGCTGTAGLGTDIVDPDPGLGPLQANGGDTRTHAIRSHSPAYDAVLDCSDLDGRPVSQDQRGVSRPQRSACDIGAFELVPYILYLPGVLRQGAF
jgi:CSLREA domain-containing protein